MYCKIQVSPIYRSLCGSQANNMAKKIPDLSFPAPNSRPPGFFLDEHELRKLHAKNAEEDLQKLAILIKHYNIQDGPDMYLQLALELAREGVLSGGSKRGKAALGDVVLVGPGTDAAVVNICFDAETSGGLLIVVHPAKASELEAALASRSVPVHAVGEVVARTDHVIELV